MVRPTLAEIRKYQLTGKLPDSLRNRREEKSKQKSRPAPGPEPPKSAREELVEVETVYPEFPRRTSPKSSFYELSNGKKVQGYEAAVEAQAQLEAE